MRWWTITVKEGIDYEHNDHTVPALKIMIWMCTAKNHKGSFSSTLIMIRILRAFINSVYKLSTLNSFNVLSFLSGWIENIHLHQYLLRFQEGQVKKRKNITYLLTKTMSFRYANLEHDLYFVLKSYSSLEILALTSWVILFGHMMFKLVLKWRHNWTCIKVKTQWNKVAVKKMFYPNKSCNKT